MIGAQRDRHFLRAVVRLIRTAARHPRLLICVDGLQGYVNAVRFVFRRPVPTGKPGRPRLEPERGWIVGQVIKQYVKRRVVAVSTRIAAGDATAVPPILERTGGGTQINTAFIERLNATFRSGCVRLVRRGRALARTEGTLRAGMYLVGGAYNFCWYHESLRLPDSKGSGRKWSEQTPAMAAGLTEERWTMKELLSYRVPPPKEAVKRRRRSKTVEPLELPLAA